MTSRAAWLHHVTLTTGDVRRSPRHEVEAETIGIVSRLLLEAIASEDRGRIVPIPAVGDGYGLAIDVAGRCLMATVYARVSDEPRVPLVTFGVAAHSRCGARLWRTMHEGRELATSGSPCPPEPWIAVIVHPTSVAAPEAFAWLADFERCVAWAWVARWGQGGWPGLE